MSALVESLLLAASFALLERRGWDLGSRSSQAAVELWRVYSRRGGS